MIIRLILVSLLVFIVFVANAFADPFPLRLRSGSSTTVQDTQNKDVKYGFSYSFEQASWYGLDARKSYVELLDKNNFDWVRLPFFWDQMTLLRQDSGGQAEYDLKIDDLKFAIEEAQKRDVKVVIVMGVKTPYYPEFHWPNYIRDKVQFGDKIDAAHPIAFDVLEIDKKLVSSLSSYDNIAYWQIENEPFLKNINQISIDRSLIAREIEVVRSTDLKRRPIILSNAARSSYDRQYRELLRMLEPGDVLGVNAYFLTQNADLVAFKLFGREVHLKWPEWFYWPVQSWGFLAPDYKTVQKDAKNARVDVWVLEMQADPYVRNLDDARRQSFVFSAMDLKRADEFVRSKGFDHIGFWGVSFWQFREKMGDASWVEVVKKVTVK